MANGFKQLKVCTETVDLLTKTGKLKPTAVQEQAIPALFAGRDVMARAQTGVGKTLAYVIPLLEKIDTQKDFVQGLIMAPTRELALQVAVEIKKLIGERKIGVLTVCGGRDFESQKHKLQGKTHIMVGTPGRLLEHLRKGNTNLGGVSYFVLDEVDEMLKQGFEEEIETIMGLLPAQHQTMLCSATINEEITKLGKKLTKNCQVIDVTPAQSTGENIRQICIKIAEEHKIEALYTLIERYNPYLMLVFCASKQKAIEVNDALLQKGVNVDVLQGDMSQVQRKAVMKAFRKAQLQVLVASDIAARGLDVEGITHVVNFDIPHDPDWYVHRIGRTGRAGRDGMAITFYTLGEGKWLTNLETKLGITMERQNLAGKTLAKTVKPHSFKPHKKAPKRGKTAVGKNKRGTKYAEASRKQKDRDGNVKDRRQEGKLSLGRGKRRRTSR